jgi:hypothetical protein
MNNDAMKEPLNELFSHLERVETQSEAILQFLKEKKRVTDKQLAPYLEQAGNAANVKWRAARVRIDHLLEPEHPEKEIKLGKKPELHEEPAGARSSEESDDAKRSEPDEKDEKRHGSPDKESADKGSAGKEDKRVELSDKENKRIEFGDQKQVESSDSKDQRAKPDDQAEPAPVKAVQARPADGNADKPETSKEKPELPETKEQVAQVKSEQKADSESPHHPTEITAPLAEQQGAEPAAQLNSKEKKSDQEAA